MINEYCNLWWWNSITTLYSTSSKDHFFMFFIISPRIISTFARGMMISFSWFIEVDFLENSWDNHVYSFVFSMLVRIFLTGRYSSRILVLYLVELSPWKEKLSFDSRAPSSPFWGENSVLWQNFINLGDAADSSDIGLAFEWMLLLFFMNCFLSILFSFLLSSSLSDPSLQP